MNAIRKIGAWFWNTKERMVLAVMVIILCYRVYQVLNPVIDDFKRTPKNPGKVLPEEVEPDEPPNPPRAVPTEDWSIIWKRPLWLWQPRVDRRDINSAIEQSVNLQLMDIKEVSDGVYRVKIRSNTIGWYDEGEKFESYELVSIDVDTDSCVIYAEEISRNIELTMD